MLKQALLDSNNSNKIKHFNRRIYIGIHMKRKADYTEDIYDDFKLKKSTGLHGLYIFQRFKG